MDRCSVRRVGFECRRISFPEAHLAVSPGKCAGGCAEARIVANWVLLGTVFACPAGSGQAAAGKLARGGWSSREAAPAGN